MRNQQLESAFRSWPRPPTIVSVAQIPWPTTLAAFAAAASAVAAILSYFINRRNVLESVRPSLVIAKWSTGTEPNNRYHRKVQGYQYLTIHKLKNLGRGPALRTWVRFAGDGAIIIPPHSMPEIVE